MSDSPQSSSGQKGSSSSTGQRKSSSPIKKRKSFSDVALEDVLVAGEEVVLRAEIHNAIFWRPVAVLIFAALVFTQVPQLGLFLFCVGLVHLGITWTVKHFLLLVITNKRVLVRYGILQMDVIDIRFDKIESIELERMLPGHIFNYANVVIMGTGQRLIRIPFVANGPAFRRFYNEMTLSNADKDQAADKQTDQ